MRRRTLECAGLLLAVAAASAVAAQHPDFSGTWQLDAAAQHPDFSGTWQLDAAASTIVAQQGLAGLGAAAPEFLHVTHARNGALILSSRVNGAQPRAYVIGGESELPAPGGEDARIRLTTAWDGAVLVSSGSGELDGLPLTVWEEMSLSADGRRLRLEISTTSGDATVTNVLVYDKQ